MDDPGSPKFLKKFSKILKGKNDAVTEEEIRSMVDVGEEIGAIENDQREMINNIFEFDDSTMEDLLEAIVGSIQDEYDNEEEEITQINENVFTVDGTTDIEEIEDLLQVKIPDGDFDTIGGFMISLLGFIPEENSVNEADYANLHLTAFDVEDRRIGKVKIERGTLSQCLAEEAMRQAEMPLI